MCVCVCVCVCVRAHHGILLGHKKECSLAIVTTRMDLEGIELVEKSQTEKTNAVFSLLYGIHKTKPNVTKPKQTHRFAEQVCGYQRGGSGECTK